MNPFWRSLGLWCTAVFFWLWVLRWVLREGEWLEKSVFDGKAQRQLNGLGHLSNPKWHLSTTSKQVICCNHSFAEGFDISAFLSDSKLWHFPQGINPLTLWRNRSSPPFLTPSLQCWGWQSGHPQSHQQGGVTRPGWDILVGYRFHVGIPIFIPNLLIPKIFVV